MTAPILNDRDLALQAAKYRSKQTNLAITGTASAFLASKNSVTVLPATIVLTATASGSVFSGSAVYTWSYALSSAPNTFITLGTGKTWTLNNSDSWVKNAFVYYRCIISENLLDSAYGYYTVTYTAEAAESAVVTLSRTNAVITCDPSGTPISFNNTDVTIIANRGSTSLAYSTNTTTANSFTVSYAVTDLTVSASPTNTSISWTLPAISAIAVDGAKITFTVTVYDASATPVATTFTRSVTYNKVSNGINNKSITVSMYYWATSAPAFSGAFTYTWSTGTVSAYPAGWSSTAGSPPGNGYSLYQRNIILSDVSTATTTASNWNLSTVNTIGFRSDGTIGVQGDSYRIAYIVTTSGTAPAQPGITTAPAVPSGWSTTATANLTDGQYMYQSDGIYSANTTNITWGIPYLSNLKVGNLQALSANLGNVGFAGGSLFSIDGGVDKTFSNAVAGIFLGNDGGTYKLKVGNASGTDQLVWDGTTLSANSLTLKDSAGNTYLQAGANLSFTNRFPNTTGLPAEGATVGAPAGTLVAGVAAETVNSNITSAASAASAAQSTATTAASTATAAGTLAGTAQSTADSKLSKTSADILTGTIQLNSTQAIYVGTTTTGLYLGSNGMTAINNNAPKFTIDANGNAIFAGNLSGATGEFAGTLRAGVLDLTTFAGISYTYNAGNVAVSTTYQNYVPAGKNKMRVTIVGGGGGGGGGTSRIYYGWYTSQGGGGGGYSQAEFTVTPGGTVEFNIGAGGSAGYANDPAGFSSSPGSDGGDGRSTQIWYNGTLILSASGGGGGGRCYADTTSFPGGYGAAGTGTLNGASYTSATAGTRQSTRNFYQVVTGTNRGGGTTSTDYYNYLGGVGGSSRYGSGGAGGIGDTATTGGIGGGQGGGGGGGGSNSNNDSNGYSAGAGSPGLVIIEYFDANSVVLQSDFQVLKAALVRQNIAVI